MQTEIVVITGCTHGIGRALALEFMRLGHCVFGCGRDKNALASLSEREETEATGSQFHNVDITDESAIKTWSKTILNGQQRQISLLINNAAIINVAVPFELLPANEFRQVIETNIIGTANIIRAFLPSMKTHQTGTIVITTSDTANTAYPNLSAYAASKAATIALAKTIASELDDGLICFALDPGGVNTRMLQSYWGVEKAGLAIGPTAWAKDAAPVLLDMDPQYNGRIYSIHR